MPIIYTDTNRDYPAGHYSGWISKTKVRNAVKPMGYELVNAVNESVNNVKTGSFGFIKDPETERLIYFSTDADAAYRPGEVLYRTAQHARDYRGGTNRYCALSELAERCKDLFAENDIWEVA